MKSGVEIEIVLLYQQMLMALNKVQGILVG